MDDKTNGQNLSQQSPHLPPTPPPAPVGSMHKEAGPTMSVETPVSEILTPTEVAPELSPEVEQAGVELSKNTELPDLTMHDRNAGVSHAPVIAPIPTQPSGMIELPIPEEQALETAKKEKNPKKSLSWYVRTILRQYLIGREKGEH